MHRLVVLLGAGATATRDDLGAALAREAAVVSGRLGRSDATVRHALEVGHNPATPGGEFGLERSDFAAVLEVLVGGGDPGPAVEAVAGLTSRLGGCVDPGASAAVLGTELQFVEGRAALQLHVGLRRLPGLSRAEFSRRWREDFAPVAVRTPHMGGYRQIHADADATTAAAQSAGVAGDDFDGVAVEWFQSAERLQEAMAWAGADSDHAAAAARFMDVAGARTILSDDPAGP